jgi:hypothetical protein
VVVVGEAAAGPTQVGDLQRLERLDDIEPDTALVGDGRVLPDPEAAVDAAAQVLGEVAVQVSADGGTWEVEIDDGASRHYQDYPNSYGYELSTADGRIVDWRNPALFEGRPVELSQGAIEGMQRDTIGEPVSIGDEAALRRGDLIYIPGHVMIYAGDGEVIHADGATMMVRRDNLAELMRAIAFPNANIIFNLQLKNPSTAPRPKPLASSPFDYVEWGSTVYPGWLQVDQAAVALTESASLLLTPGRRCQNGKPAPVDRADWKQFVAALVDVGKLARKESRARNFEAFGAISEKLNDACGNCHKVYRDRGGSEGSGARRCE